MLRRMAQRTPKTTTGRVFPAKLATPGVSFAAALRGKAEEQQQPAAQQRVVAAPSALEPRISAPSPQQPAGQSVRARNVNSEPLDNMLRVVTVVKQIMTEFNGAVSEEDKIVVITKFVLNRMQQNGH
jgi:hypothetical protein